MPPVNQSTSEAGCEQQKQQQCQEGRVNDGAGGRAAKEASIDGGALRSPLDDADIFNSLFSKWGADDATEAAAVGSLGEFLFTDAGAAGMQRTATPQLGMQLPGPNPQQQQPQQQQLAQAEAGCSGPQHSNMAAGTAQALQQQQQQQQFSRTMQNPMQAVPHMQLQQQPLQPALASAGMCGGQAGFSLPQAGLRSQGVMPLPPADAAAAAAAPQVPAWPQLMLQQVLQQQQQQLAQPPTLPGLGCVSPFQALGAFGPASMFGPAAAAAAAAAAAGGFPGLMNPFAGAAGAPLMPWQQQQPYQAQPQPQLHIQQQQQQQPSSFGQQVSPAAVASHGRADECKDASAAAAGHSNPTMHAAGEGAMASGGADVGPVLSASTAPAAPTPAVSARSLEGTLGAAAQAATGSVLPPLQQPLPHELMSALGSSMLPLPGAAPGGGLPGPGPAAAAAAAVASMLPGSWPLHLMGLLRPPSLPAVPSVMQLAMMMQAAAQASVLPGDGGLQQTAMLVAALQSMAASNMQGLFGPWGPPGMAPWQQQPQPQPQQQAAPATQNNGSCLGQFGQGLVSQGTLGFAQAKPQAAAQPGSHPQGGSGGWGGSHYLGSHHQTSTTGDYSGQAGDHPGPHSQPAGAAGMHQQQRQHPAHQWVVFNEQQQQRHVHEAQPWQAGGSTAALEAELAAVEAITPRHSRQQHKGSGKRESRRSRANNRLRVKGRFVKKGTPGAAVAGADADMPSWAEHLHTASDNEGSDGEAADEAEHQPPKLGRLRIGPSDAAAPATAPMMVDGWGTQGAAAAHTAAGCSAPLGAQPPAPAAGTDGGADDALFVSPGNTTPCWAEVVGAGFASADPAWQAARMDLQLQQQLAGPNSLAPAAAGAAQAAGSARVERIYNSKRSWVTQQIATPTISTRAPTPCDSGVTGALTCEEQRPLQRSSSGLPGAAGPTGSEGCGFPGLFRAPTGCLAAAGGAAAGGTSAACEMHTCLHLCDSNRLAAGKQGVTGLQHQAVQAGGKRKRTGSTQQGPLEPSSAAAGQAVSRCDALVSTPGTALLTCLTAAPQAAAAQPAQQAAVPEQPTQQDAAHRQPQDERLEGAYGLEGVEKRQKLGGGVADAAVRGAAADAPVHPQATQAAPNTSSSAVSGFAAAGHAGTLTPIRLAPAPIDSAAAAAQMPPPAAHMRPHSALPAPTAAVGTQAFGAPSLDVTAASAAATAAGPASLLPLQAQQQQLWRPASGVHQLPPGVAAAGVVGGALPGAGMGLPLPLLLQGLSGLPGIATQQQQQLSLAGLWPAAPSALRPWGVGPAVAAALAAPPLSPAQAVGALPGGGLLPPFATGLHAHHTLVAALTGARGVLFGGPGGGAVPGGGGAGPAEGGRRPRAEGSEQADSCLP